MARARHLDWEGVLKLVTVVLLFMPFMSDIDYPAEESGRLIVEVMRSSFASSATPLLPVAKLVLLLVAATPFVARRDCRKVVFGYYFVVLVLIGLLQNISALTTYGFVWIVGNTVVQFAAAVVCLTDLLRGSSHILRGSLRTGRIWLLAPMVLALLCPYGTDLAGNLVPAFGSGVLANDAGLSYCMVTPVILGVLLLFPDGISAPTLSYLSFLGLLFGILNLFTWFVMNPASWWMGVLHLPLVLTSTLGLVEARRKRSVARG